MLPVLVHERHCLWPPRQAGLPNGASLGGTAHASDADAGWRSLALLVLGKVKAATEAAALVSLSGTPLATPSDCRNPSRRRVGLRVPQPSSRLLDQLPRLSAQSTRHTDGLVGDEPAHADVVEPIAVDDDAVLALVQRATAVGALRDRDLEDDGRDRAAATRARRCALDGWIGGEGLRDLAHLGQSRRAGEREAGVAQGVAW